MTRHRDLVVIADDPRVAAEIRAAITGDHYKVEWVGNGTEAVRYITENLPDLVLVDGCKPDWGAEILTMIRRSSSVPVMVIFSHDDEMLKVSALDHGADDCISRPWRERELRSRVRAMLRRAEMPAPAPKTKIVVDEDLTVDFHRREVVAGGKVVPLRPTEYRLLYHLVNNAGRVLTHETLLAKVWGYEYRTEEHYVRLYVNYLRQKIEPDPRHPRYILNERGLGYRFVDVEFPSNAAPTLEPAVAASSR